MPHVIVKLYAGRSEEQKTQLAEEISKTLSAVLGSARTSISVAVEDIAPEDWTEKVYKPDIQDRAELLYQKPGYDPFQ